MKEIIWNETYSIGIEEIDRQHTEFVKLLRRFNMGIQKGIPVPIQVRILQEIIKYTDYHFTSEQNIMVFTKYPQLANHQTEHAKLLSSLDRRVEGYNRLPTHGEQLSDFLYDWFIGHTQMEDKKIADYIAHLDKASLSKNPSASL
jgi:hemerythrin-like metal-binding protein